MNQPCGCNYCVRSPDWEKSSVTTTLLWTLGFTIFTLSPVAPLAWISAFLAALGWLSLALDVSFRWEREDRRDHKRRQGLWVWFEENYGEG